MRQLDPPFVDASGLSVDCSSRYPVRVEPILPLHDHLHPISNSRPLPPRQLRRLRRPLRPTGRRASFTLRRSCQRPWTSPTPRRQGQPPLREIHPSHTTWTNLSSLQLMHHRMSTRPSTRRPRRSPLTSSLQPARRRISTRLRRTTTSRPGGALLLRTRVSRARQRARL